MITLQGTIQQLETAGFELISLHDERGHMPLGELVVGETYEMVAVKDNKAWVGVVYGGEYRTYVDNPTHPYTTSANPADVMRVDYSIQVG